ncbi:hypothetical protein D3C71_1362100 [compost metagenome]
MDKTAIGKKAGNGDPQCRLGNEFAEVDEITNDLRLDHLGDDFAACLISRTLCRLQSQRPRRGDQTSIA